MTQKAIFLFLEIEKLEYSCFLNRETETRTLYLAHADYITQYIMNGINDMAFRYAGKISESLHI